ncbi:hypothetical protein HY630_01915 [Candidatus Uhrbacteria bacterium]|nr:hypothetical protein [Candidatus Uhrbacteria bacterium]
MSEDPNATDPQIRIKTKPGNSNRTATVAGAITGAVVVLAAVLWWNNWRYEQVQQEAATQSVPTQAAEAQADEDDAAPQSQAAEDGESTSDPEAVESTPAVQVRPEPTAAAQPESTTAPAAELPVVAETATLAADPTLCTFIDGNRPQVGEKFIVKCKEGEYIALAEYKGNGIFAYSGFESHDPN